MTKHIDALTPQADSLRLVVACLQGISSNLAARDVLVREVFADGSGIEPDAFCMRLNEFARRVGATFSVPSPTSEDQACLQILSALQDIACHPLILPSAAKYRCHEVHVGIMAHVMRSGILSDPFPEFLLWSTTGLFTQ